MLWPVLVNLPIKSYCNQGWVAKNKSLTVTSTVWGKESVKLKFCCDLVFQYIPGSGYNWSFIWIQNNLIEWSYGCEDWNASFLTFYSCWREIFVLGLIGRVDTENSYRQGESSKPIAKEATTKGERKWSMFSPRSASVYFSLSESILSATTLRIL